MFPIPPSETLIENKHCLQCQSSFPITDKDLEFYEKVSPVFSGKRYSIPTPTLCPDCRQQRRLSFRNERKLYKRKCDATGKDIISIYSPDKPYTVYHQDYWWSDKWNPMEYGKEFDFTRGAMEQFQKLFDTIPMPSLVADTSLNVNSEYVNFSGSSKNCYLVFENGDCEDVQYSYHIYSSKNCVDCLGVLQSEYCFQYIDVTSCYRVFFSQNSQNCRDSYFLQNCQNCSSCFFCSNLQNKEYCIYNKQYSQDEYFREIQKIFKTPVSFYIKQFHSSKTDFIHQGNTCLGSTNSFGDFVLFSENTKQSYYSRSMKNSAYVQYFQESSDIYDAYSWGHDENFGGATRCLESVSIGNGVDQILFSYLCWENSNNVILSYLTHNSHHLLLCSGLRNASYCILNRQYTKEEYELLVPKIIEKMIQDKEWGEFFPSSMSPFGYNETVAQEYFPMTREEITASNIFHYSDYESPFPKVEKIIPAKKLPEDIKDIPDDILNWAIECEVTKKPYRIIRQELDFYRKHSLPIPRCHPDQRHLDRMKLRNPRKLHERKCDHCGVNMITTYSPERIEKVYCDDCYKKEVLN